MMRAAILLSFLALACRQNASAPAKQPAAPAQTAAPSRAAPPKEPKNAVEDLGKRTENVPPGADTSANSMAADQREAVDVVTRYYRAIDSHDFKQAYAMWGPSGPPGQTFQQFADGFRDTATVEVAPGVPGRIGAAAGSRYIDIPVRVTATTKAGTKETFEGTYIVRRAVVDGATAEQRAWHLYRGSLHRASVP